MAFEDGSILVLAGGRSRRMGRDKRLIAMSSGSFLLERTIEKLKTLNAPIFLAVAADDASRPHLEGVAFLWDRRPHEGPLTALIDASEAIEGSILAVAADLPGLQARFLEELVKENALHPEAWAVVPRREERAHPLCAVYRPKAIERLREAAEGSQRSFREALESFPSGRVYWWEVKEQESLHNWNRRDDREHR